MARQQRSTTFSQESTRPITQVALYARVSTLNNQDPEMQPWCAMPMTVAFASLRLLSHTPKCTGCSESP
jgi:hypothetical protein